MISIIDQGEFLPIYIWRLQSSLYFKRGVRIYIYLIYMYICCIYLHMLYICIEQWWFAEIKLIPMYSTDLGIGRKSTQMFLQWRMLMKNYLERTHSIFIFVQLKSRKEFRLWEKFSSYFHQEPNRSKYLPIEYSRKSITKQFQEQQTETKEVKYCKV